MKKCAVKDCKNEGKTQFCPYDSRYHYHGCIHYTCHKNWCPNSKLEFESEGWFWICDTHYNQILEEIKNR